MLCPICLKDKSSFENHHVIWRCDGGSDDPINILRICKTCHAITTRGDDDEAYWRDKACVAHQQASYGLNFELRARADGTSKIVNDLLNDLPRFEASSLCTDGLIREMGIARYHITMGVIHGIIDPDDVFDKNYDKVLPKLICCLQPDNGGRMAAEN